MTSARRARLAVMATFVTHAAVFATWAPRIPSLKSSLALDHEELGIALGVMAVGLLVGTRLTGRMEKRARTARPIRLLMPVQCLALAGPAYATNLVTLSLALFALGLLGGLIDVAMNAHAVAVERGYGRPIMSGFHGLWSTGMMGASAVAALVARYEVGVRWHFVVAGIVLAVASVPLLRWLLPAGDEATVMRQSAPSAGEPRRYAAPIVVAVLAGVGFGGFLVEGAVMDWGAVFMYENRAASESAAALAVTVFTGSMAASRLAGDRLRARIGSVALARLGAAVGVAGLGTALLVDLTPLTMLGLAVLGLGLGPVVPIVFSSAGNMTRRGSASVLSIAVSGGYVGGFLGPVAIGGAAGWAGLTWALVIPLAFLVVIFIASRLFVEPQPTAQPAAHGHREGSPVADNR